ncbi:MAG: hypothetical protein LUC45_09275 [Paraprevotella sp.]|nr:hypothetical protein [Paraprevotella sp.]
MKKIKACGLFLALMLCGWQSVAAQPTTPAPTPPHAASEVKSLFSDAYTPFSKFEYTYADWTGSTTKTIITPFGDSDEVLNIEGLTTGSTQNNAQISLGTCYLADKNYIHMDVYSPGNDVGIGEFSYYLVSGWGAKTACCNNWYNFTSTETHDQWVSIDVPMSEFKNQGLDLTNINILRIVRGKQGSTGNVVYVDNIYAYNDGESGGETGGEATGGGSTASEPTFSAAGNADLTTDVPLVSAPTPQRNASDVKSFFSDYYTSAYKFDEGQSYYGDLKTEKSIITINGTDDQILKIDNLANGAKANVSLGSANLADMDMLHMDIFSPGNEQGIG